MENAEMRSPEPQPSSVFGLKVLFRKSVGLQPARLRAPASRPAPPRSHRGRRTAGARRGG